MSEDIIIDLSGRRYLRISLDFSASAIAYCRALYAIGDCTMRVSLFDAPQGNVPTSGTIYWIKLTFCQIL